MERYGVEWLQKGTHEKHLSVVAQLGEEVSIKKQELLNVSVEKELAEEAVQKAKEERTTAQQEKEYYLQVIRI